MTQCDFELELMDGKMMSICDTRCFKSTVHVDAQCKIVHGKTVPHCFCMESS